MHVDHTSVHFCGMKSIWIAVCFFFFSFSLSAQWDQYFASWEGKPGSVILNMGWYELAPVTDLPQVAISTIYNPAACRADGFPQDEYYDQLDESSERMVDLISSVPGTEVVGSFLHNCEKRDYFYTNDTSVVKMIFDTLDWKVEIFGMPELKILQDEEWKIYRTFLYPDPYLKESMTNKRVVNELQAAGVDIKKRIRIDHNARFTSSKQRDQFKLFLMEQGFRIDVLHRQGSDYTIRFSRKNTPDLRTMNEITVRLTFEAESRGGAYLGWEVKMD